jgi:hypothetical protein
MKINRLETHDRLLHFKQDQANIISQGVDECLKSNPLSLALQERSNYIYIFAHTRTADDGVTKRMLWQPRLGKPSPQTNSYLFRADSHTDLLEICWILPPEEMWKQYKKGNVTESDIVLWSIDQFKNHKELLAQPIEGDLSKDQIANIYTQIGREMDQDKQRNAIKPTLVI